ncbi:hypothetical protein BegalDRAFT_1930 [Beggiatoa alba B18LD]|uniref:Uncharacterized protein n=1 Tax=Beggiatoa alba B18LD TaxID=395493 RepID=I3CGQ9_9GAMM|nr:hypothetical protein [Beggiatoa alba]EIJ42802.1 hypothetical protein BegalDRAFT_1930 [Beggiatoa alba B18LD]
MYQKIAFLLFCLPWFAQAETTQYQVDKKVDGLIYLNAKQETQIKTNAFSFTLPQGWSTEVARYNLAEYIDIYNNTNLEDHPRVVLIETPDPKKTLKEREESCRTEFTRNNTLTADKVEYEKFANGQEWLVCEYHAFDRRIVLADTIIDKVQYSIALNIALTEWEGLKTQVLNLMHTTTVHNTPTEEKTLTTLAGKPIIGAWQIQHNTNPVCSETVVFSADRTFTSTSTSGQIMSGKYRYIESVGGKNRIKIVGFISGDNGLPDCFGTINQVKGKDLAISLALNPDYKSFVLTDGIEGNAKDLKYTQLGQ